MALAYEHIMNLQEQLDAKDAEIATLRGKSDKIPADAK